MSCQKLSRSKLSIVQNLMRNTLKIQFQICIFWRGLFLYHYHHRQKAWSFRDRTGFLHHSMTIPNDEAYHKHFYESTGYRWEQSCVHCEVRRSFYRTCSSHSISRIDRFACTLSIANATWKQPFYTGPTLAIDTVSAEPHIITSIFGRNHGQR